jgi:MFS family permease
MFILVVSSKWSKVNNLVLFTTGTILGSFFYGYIVLQIPGGYLAYRFGGTKVFGMSLLIGSLLTLLTPFVARTSVAALIALRVLEGVFLVRYTLLCDNVLQCFDAWQHEFVANTLGILPTKDRNFVQILELLIDEQTYDLNEIHIMYFTSNNA